MFNRDFDVPDASPLLTNQRGLAAMALAAASANDPEADAEFLQSVRQTRDRLTESGFSLTGEFVQAVLVRALMNLQTGDLDAALGWARSIYVMTRRIAHGWLPLLNFVVSAKIFPAALVRRTPRKSARPVGEARLPRRIVQHWDKAVPPEDVAVLIETWRRAEGFSHDLADDGQARAFLAEHFGDRVLHAYDAATHVAGKADLFRLAWLHLHGGIYADADERLTAPIDSIVPADCTLFLTWCQGVPPSVQNWFIAAEPANKVIEMALMLAVKRVEYSRRTGIKLNAWIQTGPGAVSMAVLDDFALHGKPVAAAGLHLMADRVFRQAVWPELGLEYRRHAAGNWRLES